MPYVVNIKLLNAKSHNKTKTKMPYGNNELLNAKTTQKASGSKANLQMNTKNKPTQTTASKKKISLRNLLFVPLEKILFVSGP